MSFEPKYDVKNYDGGYTWSILERDKPPIDIPIEFMLELQRAYAEIERLEKLNRDNVEWLTEMMINKTTILRKALEWYANKAHYQFLHAGGDSSLIDDEGEHARKALEQAK